MMNKKRILYIVFALIIFILTFSGCKDDYVSYQNQYLNVFGVDSVTTKHQKIETDDLKDYIYIELNESEKSKMDENILFSSNIFYDISENNGDYIILNEILENCFSENIKNIDYGYFSVYNKVSQQIIDLYSVDFQKIDMDFFTAFIYDSENGIVYLFDYNLS